MPNNRGLILDGHKLAWHQERVSAWLRGERIAPITIDMALSQECSYRCQYCYKQLQGNTGHVLSEAAIKGFLNDAAAIGVKAISFVSDGESTCSPHVYEALLYGKQLGLDMALGTNGYLLQDKRLGEILPVLTYIRFNFSAGTPQQYSKIHGATENHFNKVIATIKKSVAIKRTNKLQVTIGMQMVLLPEYAEEIVPLARLGQELGVDYLVIKHCSDDEQGSLGINYDDYAKLTEILRQAEKYSTDTYRVQVKWSKVLSSGKKSYSQCFGPPFILQLSGSGLVAPCGMLFHEKYQEQFHIGNIAEKSFKEIWQSERYWKVMHQLSTPAFNAREDCGKLCLQHKVNEYLNQIKETGRQEHVSQENPPLHVNFI